MVLLFCDVFVIIIQVFMLKYAIRWVKFGRDGVGYEVQGKKVYIAGFFQNLLVVSDASEHLISSEIQYLFFILFIYWSRNFSVAARIIFNFNLAKYAKKKWRIIDKNELALLHPRFSTSFAQFLTKFYPSFYSLFTTNATLQSYRYYVAISIVNVLIRSNLFFQSFRTVYT